MLIEVVYMTSSSRNRGCQKCTYGNYREYFYAPNNILRQEFEQRRD